MKTKMLMALMPILSVVFLSAGTLHLEKGWEIISFGELNRVDINKTLSFLDDGSLAWTYNDINKSWSAKSNNLDIDSKIASHNYPFAHYVDKYQGLWIFNAGASIDLDTCKLAPNEEIIEPIADTYVYAYSWHNWNNANFGAYGSLFAGYSSAGGESRSYIKFNLSDVDISHVKKVELRLLNGAQYAGTDNIDLGIYAVASDWNEGNGTYHSGDTEENAPADQITWNNQPSIDTTLVASFNPSNYDHGSMMQIDITNLIKLWKSTLVNYGLVIKPLVPSGNSQWVFTSREYPDKDMRPAIIISKDCNASN